MKRIKLTPAGESIFNLIQLLAGLDSIKTETYQDILNNIHSLRTKISGVRTRTIVPKR